MRYPEWLYRRASSRYRKLPDFLIIGAQKSGTSSLFHYLGQHPALRPAFRKEVHYFDGGLKNGESWYRSHFCLDSPGGHQAVKAFEASPLYLFHPLAARRIHDRIPGMKLVVVLRNPVERAISQYFHSRRHGRESLPLMEALQQEDERLAAAIRNENYEDESFIHHSYKRRGLYH